MPTILAARRVNSVACERCWRVSNLGWLSKVLLKLDDGQVIVAQIPNDRFNGLGSGDRVFATADDCAISRSILGEAVPPAESDRWDGRDDLLEHVDH